MERRFFGLLAKTLISLALVCYASGATPIFFGNNSGQGGGASISVNANWGETDCNSSSSCTSTSVTRTISGSGTIKMVISSGHVCQYSQNAGAFTTFSSGGTLAVSNTDTLAFKITVLAPGEIDVVTVTDNSTLGLVGAFTAENLFGGGG